MTVKIVTDSTASIPLETCRRLGIAVIPVPVQFGPHTFIDSVDPPAQFYTRLSDEEPPHTSTPSPGTFLEAYRRLAAEASTVISIHMMETKSTLINVARMASRQLSGCDIRVVDSQTTTLGLGLLATTAAQAAQAGRPAAEIQALLERLIPNVHVFGAIRHLTQLRRSGRVSLTQALLGGMLAIKPILYVGQGVADVVDKVRGWPHAIDRIVELALEKVGGAPVRLAVVHTNGEQEAVALLEQVKSRFQSVEAFVAEAGIAVASHAGPGAIGIAALKVE